MRVVAVEEHFLDPEIAAVTGPAMAQLSPGFVAAYVATGDFPSPLVAQDLGAGRLAAMDAGGIEVQVLSCPGGQLLPAESALELSRKVNDRLAKAVREYPDRFAALATLPTAVPEDAAAELSRCVTELGLVGALITGRTEGEFLDAPRFDPVLESVARHQVPIYLHPGVPPRAVSDATYAGNLQPAVTARLQTAAWGWHQDTAAHFLRLVLSGVLDRYPKLQIILGHWGELLPYFLDRINEELPTRVTKLERSFAEYFRENVYISPSGMFSQAQLQYCVATLATERILFSVDYPVVELDGSTQFLEQANLSDETRRRIAHENADRLFGLSPN